MSKYTYGYKKWKQPKIRRKKLETNPIVIWDVRQRSLVDRFQYFG
jgi:hypothetical protein